MIELRFHFRRELCQRKLGPVAAHEAVFRLVAGERVEEGLPHRELVEVGVEQRLDHGDEGGAHDSTSFEVISFTPCALARAKKASAAASKPGTGLMQSRRITTRLRSNGVL